MTPRPPHPKKTTEEQSTGQPEAAPGPNGKKATPKRTGKAAAMAARKKAARRRTVTARITDPAAGTRGKVRRTGTETAKKGTARVVAAENDDPRRIVSATTPPPEEARPAPERGPSATPDTDGHAEPTGTAPLAGAEPGTSTESRRTETEGEPDTEAEPEPEAADRTGDDTGREAETRADQDADAAYWADEETRTDLDDDRTEAEAEAEARAEQDANDRAEAEAAAAAAEQEPAYPAAEEARTGLDDDHRADVSAGSGRSASTHAPFAPSAEAGPTSPAVPVEAAQEPVDTPAPPAGHVPPIPPLPTEPPAPFAAEEHVREPEPLDSPAGEVPLPPLPAEPPAPVAAEPTATSVSDKPVERREPAETAVSPALDALDRDRLLRGEHHDPHSVLGAHPVAGGVAFRAYRPYALGVAVVVDGTRTRLHDDGDGFFSGLLPLSDVPAYRLAVSYEGTEHETADAYALLPTLGDLDLHLIGEGRHEQLWKVLGAEPMEHHGVAGTRFTVWAPNARGVQVAGTFNYWNSAGHPMRSLGSSGVWELFVPGVGEGELYKFRITKPDGSTTLRADPMARRTEVPPATSSIVQASHHTWQDGEWLSRRGELPWHEAPMSVYEVHLASWRPGLTYRQLAEQLPAYVGDLGFTHVELMPVAEHPFGGSWGYQVTGFYAPTARMGTPDDFKYLVDALHRAGIGVIMDWVPAHFPRDEWALAEFDGRPLYEHEDPLRSAHPDWGTLEFDFGRREVRNFLVANAVYWAEEFHIDGLRVDAVASMLYLDYSREPGQWVPNEHGGRENLDAVAFLQEMNATLYRRVPGVVTIAEESTAWDGVTRATHQRGPSGFGGLGFGLKWNMGWMHDSLEYMSHDPVHRSYHHGEMTFSMVYAYSENYVLPISHDEVVHGKKSLVSKMPGDWWQQRANLRAYLAFMWAHPGKQLLFMGSEFAQGTEWSEAHGPDWWLLDPGYGAEADHRGVRDLVRDLNVVYRDTPGMWRTDTDPAGFQWVVGDAAADNVLAFLRLDKDGGPLLAVSNFSPVVRHEYRLGVPDTVSAWAEVLNTDAGRYGGGDVVTPHPVKPDAQGWHGRPASVRLTLPPLATVWLRPA
ncbi:1,4-alpha-glucan branching enzyme [Streptomyces sp. NPDC090306]|uniref:1,4-alpha-glucan branching enzyme n=1 Tax=Streptomyces sp. NPDC090306 TaxID=3365961 RepID=UPI0038030A6D